MDGKSSRFSCTAYSRTALQSAVLGGHVETARFLLERGADVNAAPARLKSPLHLACRAGPLDLVRILLEAGADVYAYSYGGKTVRQSAIQGGSPEILRLLDEAEANTSPPEPRNREIDLASITKKELCAYCRAIPFEVFDPDAPHNWDHRQFGGWHPSLITLRDGTLQGCPFCMFFWKQLGIKKINIPQPSAVRLYQSFGTATPDAMYSQVQEPHPKDVERPKGLRVDFHACVEPLEGS